MMSWNSRKKKEDIFYNVYFARRTFSNIRVLFQPKFYWIDFQNNHTFTYQKTLLHILSKAFSVFLIRTRQELEESETLNTVVEAKEKFKVAQMLRALSNEGTVIINNKVIRPKR